MTDIDREIVRLDLEDKAALDISGIPEFMTGVTSEKRSQEMQPSR